MEEGKKGREEGRMEVRNWDWRIDVVVDLYIQGNIVLSDHSGAGVSFANNHIFSHSLRYLRGI